SRGRAGRDARALVLPGRRDSDLRCARSAASAARQSGLHGICGVFGGAGYGAPGEEGLGSGQRSSATRLHRSERPEAPENAQASRGPHLLVAGCWSAVGWSEYPQRAMIRLGRWVAVVGSALAIAVAVGCASGAGAAPKVVSPCGTAGLPAWSPDGTQIAWYGHRWPRPNTHHGGGDIVLRAICVSDADGKHVHKVSHTVCSERCFRSMSDPPDQLYWLKPSLLLYGNDFGIGAIPGVQSPKLLGKRPPERFSVDSAGDRVSAGAVSSCTSTGCAGPVKILGVPSGAVAGAVGGPKVINTEPSLSPDGTQVVFARFPANDSGKRLGIWTASADGSHLKRLVRGGSNPLWSPA